MFWTFVKATLAFYLVGGCIGFISLILVFVLIYFLTK